MIEFRRPDGCDFEKMLGLQNRNLLLALGSDELSDGFLNTAFSAAQFQEMDQEVAVVVAVEEGQVAGYLCAATPSWNQAFPFPAGLVKQAGAINYRNKPLIAHRCCVVNPVCVDRSYRGGIVFAGLYQTMQTIISVSYEIALALVSTANPRSLSACQKAMTVVGQFEVQQKTFWMLMRDLTI